MMPQACPPEADLASFRPCLPSCVMDVTLILIDNDAELARARALVEQLWRSDDPADIARLQAQANLIAAYEEGKWPRRAPSTADLIRHLMDQHGLTRADI